MNKLLKLKNYLFILVFLFSHFGYSQYSDPNITLTSGLDNIAFNKGKLDVEVLTKIIKEKQKEILREGLRISYHKSLDNIENPFTKHYFQQIVSIFFNETNHKVITKQMLKETTQYVFLIGMNELIDTHAPTIFIPLQKKIHERIQKENDNDKITELNNLNSLKTELLKSIAEKNKKEEEKLTKQINEINLTLEKTKILTTYIICKNLVALNTKGLIYNELDIKKITTDNNQYKIIEDIIENNIENKKNKQEISQNKDLAILIDDLTELTENIDVIKTITDISKNYGINDIEKITESLITRQNKINLTDYFKSEELNNPPPKYISSILKTSLDIIDDYLNPLQLLNQNLETLQPHILDKLKDSKTTLSIEDIDNLEKLTIKYNTIINQQEKVNSNYKKFNENNTTLKGIFKSLDTVKDKKLTENLYNQIKTYSTNLNTTDSTLFKDTDKDVTKITNVYQENIFGILDDIILKKDHYKQPEEIDLPTKNFELFRTLNKIEDSIINNKSPAHNSLVLRLKSVLDTKISNYLTISSDSTKITINKSKINSLISENLNKTLKIDDFQSLANNISYFKIYFDNISSYKNNIINLQKKINLSYIPPNDLFDKINILISDTEISFNDKLSKEDNETINKFYNLFYNNTYSSTNNKNDLLKINEFNNQLRVKMLVIANKQDSITRKKLHNTFKLIQYTADVILQEKLEEHSERIDKFETINNTIQFLSNIQNLNTTETFEYILNILSDSKYKNFFKIDDDNIDIANIITGLQKYTIIDKSENSIEIDAASILSDFAYKYKNTDGWSFFVNVGLNQNIGFNSNITKNGNRYFSTASEKIGIKHKWYSDNYKREWINHSYWMLYLSGIIYEVTNASGDGFSSTNFGTGFGLNFFNSLEFNIHAAIPFETNPGKKIFVGFSFDIPLSEYLKRL